MDNCRGCHIENAGKVTVLLNSYQIQVWLKTVIPTEGKKQHPFFLLEKQQHGLEWHVAHQVFRFVHKGSYDKKALLVVHAGLERGVERETVK